MVSSLKLPFQFTRPLRVSDCLDLSQMSEVRGATKEPNQLARAPIDDVKMCDTHW